MSSRLDSKPQIWTLAADLGLGRSASPTGSILAHVKKRIKQIAKKFSCENLNSLLVATAGEVGTIFEEIRSDDGLRRVRQKYLERGESAFANLENDLRHPDDLAITIRRLHREAWEPEFVSIIDCRGDKIYRSYFSRWHELAHLLTLTPQMRLVFRRTHAEPSVQDPEELLMDVIASTVGFFRDFLPSEMQNDISFEGIRQIQEEFCPEASKQAALINIVKVLPQPCILIEAKLGLRKSEGPGPDQLALGIGRKDAIPELRAVHVTVNNAARDSGVRFHRNWRVPARSVISRAFLDGGYAESTENLSWWTTSAGGSLGPCRVVVKAKKTWDSVQALLIPIL